MDSLTQIVLGAAVGEAVAGRKMGAKAALWGAIGGTIPDLDVFLRFFYDPLDAALVHRGFSHSLLFALIAGIFLMYFSGKGSGKKYTHRTWFLLWFLSIVTHPMLDIFTNYGTQFFWPLDWRLTFNSVFVIDPLYTLPFMVLLIGALFMNRESKRRRIWNWIGIGYSCLYLLWGVGIKLFVYSKTDSYFEQAAIHPKRAMVTPMPLTSFYWDLIVEDDSCYYIGYKSLFAPFDPKQIEVLPKNHQLLKNIRWQGKSRITEIEHITNGFYAVEQHRDSLFIFDLRFGTTTTITNGTSRNPLLGYGFILKDQKPEKLFSHRSRDFSKINFSVYWDKVFGK
ncbi:metal-dependent hydrolase [Fluviicola chungangensis]|uniref:Metal-dependent hydrolase n=1 Tax=Fluviicola chungangensis TaxID=2597671 RepID=A0A556MMU0_9FLAO|nr:metal-dependent hydrolase [Fluviicola chungangensis]TSJ41233.1 metal-dependent hydrolase [Fluviicola chungangensis]